MAHPSSRAANAADWICSDCGFGLWLPLTTLRVSAVGLYSDARFPGRLIVSMNDHIEHFDQADPNVLAAFMSDLQDASIVLRKMPSVERVNIAVLGNKEPHLHAHVIPRRLTDENFGVAPWENAAPYAKLTDVDQRHIVDELLQRFDEVRAGSGRYLLD